MKNPHSQVPKKSRAASPPYDELYIYYLEGRVMSEPVDFGAHFIGNWHEDGFSFLFFTRPSADTVGGILDAQRHLTLIDKYHMTYEQWQGDKIRPFSAGRFYIAPPWESGCIPQHQTGIVLDPGVVFGTGTHPTTRDCLRALDCLADPGAIGSVLDLGTGTGVLALAAARLGCRRTLAVDFNFLAAATAAENVRRNKMADRVLVIQGRAEDWVHFPADLLIANIHHDIMQRLIRSDGFFEKKWFVLSGLMTSQARETIHWLKSKPVEIVEKWEHEGIWHTFLGRAC